MQSAAIILNQAFPDSASASDQAFKMQFKALFEAWQDLADICLARVPTEEQRSVYAHGREILERHGSIGYFMNQGAEAKHKE
eukprot:1896327-Rhodomonas_salina.1